MSLACEEARDALVDPPIGDTDRERIAAHRVHCQACRADLERLETVTRSIERAAGGELDDVTRARMHGRIAGALDQMAAERARGAGASMPGLALALRFAPVLASLAIIAVFSYGAVVAYRAVRTVSGPPAAPVVAVDRRALRPYVVSGAAAQSALGEAQLGRASVTVEAPADGMLRAALGRRARITLIGPARLEVEDADERATSARLDSGVLLAQYDHAPSASLRIRARGIEVKVVGTIFSVDARDESPTVGVLQGVVAVTTRDGAEVRVREKEMWSERTGVEPLTDEQRRALEDHARALLPPRAHSGTLILSGSPEHAIASAGGSPIGPAPLRALLPVGRSEVELRSEGMETKVISARIAEDESTALGFELSKLAPPPERPAHKALRAPRPQPEVVAETPESLYAEAESALREGDRVRAKAALEGLVDRHGDHRLADTAAYELARLYNEDGDRAAAKKKLLRIAQHARDRSLVEPARYMLCRIAIDDGDGARGASCLETFRSDFPSSPHDAEALLFIASFHAADRDCQVARPLFEEYLRRYADRPQAEEAKARRDRCAP
jgi:TolA-binding protein